MLELKIALPQHKFPELEQHLWEVSDPSHPRYGAHLSKEETDALTAPHPETLDIVNEWLASYGLEEESLVRSSANDWVTIRVPVGLAEEMLDTVSKPNLVSRDYDPLTAGCLDLSCLQAR
jgi:tripeptidyl-peptidase-1